MTDITSFTAEKAKRTNNAADWSPLDVIKDVLAKIEAGDITPKHLVICFTEVNPHNNALTDVRYSASVPDVIVGTGLMHRAVHLMGNNTV